MLAAPSEASNFVPGDEPGTADVFVRDRRIGRTELISRGINGLPAGASVAPSISADGRFVAFQSFSDRLVPDGNPNFFDHVYVFDRLDRSMERIDVASDGALADGGAFNVAISGNGRFVAFDSAAGNLVAGDGDQAFDVFVHDRRTGKTEGISTPQPADTFTGRSLLDSISPDGRFVVFSSRADNLVRGDTNGSVDVFRRDLEKGTTERIAADDISASQPFGFEVVAGDITPDARSVALLTRADLRREQDVGFFAADVYVVSTNRLRQD